MYHLATAAQNEADTPEAAPQSAALVHFTAAALARHSRRRWAR